MSKSNRGSPRSGTFSAAAFARALGLIVLIVTQILIVDVMTVWALSGLFELAPSLSAGLALIIAIPSVWAVWMTVKWVWKAEKTAESL